MPGWVFTMKLPRGLLWGIWIDSTEVTPSTRLQAGDQPFEIRGRELRQGVEKDHKEGRLRQDGPGCF